MGTTKTTTQNVEKPKIKKNQKTKKDLFCQKNCTKTTKTLSLLCGYV
jgi:hypothetical protein